MVKAARNTFQTAARLILNEDKDGGYVDWVDISEYKWLGSDGLTVSIHHDDQREPWIENYFVRGNNFVQLENAYE